MSESSPSEANDLCKIGRALLSVSDKSGLIEFARALADHGVELLSTGGSAKQLRDAGLTVVEVSDHTGFPEMMDGRVKTLHPKVHGGLLARRDLESHRKAMEDHAIGGIDLVAINLYPFEETVAAGAGFERYPALLEANRDRVVGAPEVLYPRAADVLVLAAAALETGPAIDPADLRPAYLRQEVAKKPGG